MCGIAGYIHRSICDERCAELEKRIHQLQSCRGPDNQTALTLNGDRGWVAHLFHQHLRVADLSSAANQPMKSLVDPDLQIVLNGEIYNHRELVGELPQKPRTHSDTEVLIEHLAKHGTLRTLERIRGMFAWATINTRTSTLEMVRDRFGEKPLHIYREEDSIVFGSQYDSVVVGMKVLGQNISFDANAVSSYLNLGYVPYRQSLVANVEKLAPGASLTFELNSPDWTAASQKRWVPLFHAGQSEKFSPDALEAVLTSAVSEQLVADVPVGLFLSGGVDSSLVSAIAQKVHTQSMHSFSIGFEELDFDESRHALSVAKSIGTTHHAATMTGKDALNVLEKVVSAYSEPLGDPSVFPTTFVSEFAREHVTVCLTGDGADELFFGYGRYNRFQNLESARNSHPQAIRLVGKLLDYAPQGLAQNLPRIKRLAGVLQSQSDFQTYLSLIGFPHMAKDFLGLPPKDFSYGLSAKYLQNKIAGKSINWLRELDADSYLTDDILVKVDRAAMAFGLETRAPFLDNRVASIAATIDAKSLNDPTQKAILKSIVKKYVPADAIDRRKQGFGAPVGDWLRTTLRDWGDTAIRESGWEHLGLEHGTVRRHWEELLASNDQSATFSWVLISLGAASQRLMRL